MSFKEFSVFRSAAILFSGAETFDGFVQGPMSNQYIKLYYFVASSLRDVFKRKKFTPEGGRTIDAQQRPITKIHL